MIGNAEQLREMLENGELDIAFSGISPLAPECIEKEFLFDERLYLVVSEQMLEWEGLRWIVCTHHVILTCICRCHRRICRRV